jgi:hypothetical protein
MHCIADGLAKQARELLQQSTYHKLPSDPVRLVIKNHTITANHTKVASDAYHSIKLSK